MEKITNVDKYLTANLRLNMADALEYSGVYDARVEEVRKETFLISAPTDKGLPMPVRPGMKLEISFISTGGRYAFHSVIKGRVVQNIPMLELSKPAYLIKSELREFFRIDVMRRVNLYVLERDLDSGKMRRKETRQVMCVDISGGGMRIFSGAPFGGARDVEVDCSGFIPELLPIAGTVVRSGTTSDGKYDLGIKFTSLRDSDRDKIVKYVFQRQIEMRMLKKR